MATKTLFSNAMILGAGVDSRTRPLSEVTPKKMALFCGTTLVRHWIKLIQPVVNRLYVTLGHLGGAYAHHVVSHSITGVLNTTSQKNGWWIGNTALNHIEEPMLVSTCDNLFGTDFELLRADYGDNGGSACMIVPIERSTERGDRLEIRAGLVKRIGSAVSDGPLASGMQILRLAEVTRLAKGATDFHDIWNRLAATDQLAVSSVSPTRWAAIDTLQDLLEN